LLNSHGVEFLLIGGYAVAFHGYPRATGDIDLWVPVRLGNAERLVRVLREFGFDSPELSPSLFMQAGRLVRMGVPPVRIEIATGISGVDFDECFASRVQTSLDGVDVPVISLADLRRNKRAAGRHKDLEDLENLP
jgi:hypothetical protein